MGNPRNGIVPRESLYGDIKRETAPFSLPIALDPNFTAMEFYKTFCECQPKSCPLVALRFRFTYLPEGTKNSGFFVMAYTNSCVQYGDF